MSLDLPLLVSPAELAAQLNHPDLILIDLCRPELYPQAHLPGALYVAPAETMAGMPPAPGLLPPRPRLQALVKRLGLQAASRVVVYDDEGGGWAGRMIWLLESIGFDQASLLDGGILAWHAEQRPLTRDVPPWPNNGRFEIVENPAPTITLEALMAQVGDPNLIVWDARSPMEHAGIQQGARRNGHIPGAVNFEWTRAMDTTRDLRLRPLEELRAELAELGITPQRQVVTHCQSHHRSGLTYVVGRLLGLPIRAYAGSWSEWGNHPATPIESP